MGSLSDLRVKEDADPWAAWRGGPTLTGSAYGQTGTKPTAGNPGMRDSIFSRTGSKVIHCKRRLRCLEKAWDTPQRRGREMSGENRTPGQYKDGKQAPGV